MNNNRKLFTSESVTEGHPDKVCDRISDAVLDDILAHDPNARVACETICTTGLVMVCGEISTNALYNVQQIVRNTVEERRTQLNECRQQGEDVDALYDSWQQVLIVIDNRKYFSIFTHLPRYYRRK